MTDKKILTEEMCLEIVEKIRLGEPEFWKRETFLRGADMADGLGSLSNEELDVFFNLEGDICRKYFPNHEEYVALANDGDEYSSYTCLREKMYRVAAEEWEREHEDDQIDRFAGCDQDWLDIDWRGSILGLGGGADLAEKNPPAPPEPPQKSKWNVFRKVLKWPTRRF